MTKFKRLSKISVDKSLSLKLKILFWRVADRFMYLIMKYSNKFYDSVAREEEKFLYDGDGEIARQMKKYGFSLNLLQNKKITSVSPNGENKVFYHTDFLYQDKKGPLHFHSRSDISQKDALESVVKHLLRRVREDFNK